MNKKNGGNWKRHPIVVAIVTMSAIIGFLVSVLPFITGKGSLPELMASLPWNHEHTPEMEPSQSENTVPPSKGEHEKDSPPTPATSEPVTTASTPERPSSITVTKPEIILLEPSDAKVLSYLPASLRTKYKSEELLDGNDASYWQLDEYLIKDGFKLELEFNQGWNIDSLEIIRPEGPNSGSYLKELSIRARLTNGTWLPKMKYSISQDTGPLPVDYPFSGTVEQIEFIFTHHWNHWFFVVGDFRVYGSPNVPK